MSSRIVERVNARVSVLKPVGTSPPSKRDAGPSAILICGWMDAKFSTLLKYSQAYDALFPHATHIIVEQNLGGFWLPRRIREQEIEPIARLLVEAGVDWTNPSASRGLIVHTFSNGGCYRLVQLASAMRRLYLRPQGRLPATAMIFDSCPGRSSFIQTHRALMASFPNVLLKALFTLFYALTYFTRWLVVSLLLRQPQHIDATRHALERPDVLPWTTPATPRVYMYSPRDTMVMSADVEAHVATLRQGGMNAKLEKFAASAHVAHARVEPERYWHAVRDAWEEAQAAARDL